MIYLLHFSAPVAGARHFLGFADDVDRRLAEHRAGQGANLTRIAVERGASLAVVMTVEGDRDAQRNYRRIYKGCFTALCPVCNPRRPRKFQFWGGLQ